MDVLQYPVSGIALSPSAHSLHRERERERIWHEVDSEQDRGEGRSWEALKELHLFEE